MTITLITQETYNTLVSIMDSYPNLTYQNTGYDYPDKGKWSEEDKRQFKVVTDILSKAIQGFYSFNHFRLSKKEGEKQIRFQYDWCADDITKSNLTHFSGVGYLNISELLNGFTPDKNPETISDGK